MFEKLGGNTQKRSARKPRREAERERETEKRPEVACVRTVATTMALPHPFSTLLPLRFLLQVFHLIAVLTVVYDTDGIAKQLVGDAGGDVSRTKATLEAVSWAAIVCLAVDFAGLFMGFSIFSIKMSCFHILCHFLGFLLVALFVSEYWKTESYTYLFVFFNLLPTTVEMYVAFTVIRVKVLFSA